MSGSYRKLQDKLLHLAGQPTRSAQSQPSQNPYMADYLRTATQYEQDMAQILHHTNQQSAIAQQRMYDILNTSGQQSERAQYNLHNIAEQAQHDYQQSLQQLLQGTHQPAFTYPSYGYESSHHHSSYHTYPPQSFPHQPTTQTTPYSNPPSSSTAPAPPPGPTLHAPPPSKPTLFPPDALAHLPTRPVAARARLGKTAVQDARNGLSRVIDASSFQDIQLFADQLRRADTRAIEMHAMREDPVPVFAVSYVQRNPPVGRYKFDNDQWEALVRVIGQLVDCGVRWFRLWLDQCLWLRDASQAGWAHTGLLPYIMWPVISLGVKRVGGEYSVETDRRMWPFLEEICGLWGMGVMFAREMRGQTPREGWRKWMSYAHRARLEPEQAMQLLLLNIFHGAADHLETGWQEDVKELKEMARANVLLEGTELYIGADWKQRISVTRASLKSTTRAIQDMVLPVKQRQAGVNMFLDGSRAVMCGSWHGTREWLSGDAHGMTQGEGFGASNVTRTAQKVQVLCDEGEFVLLKVSTVGTALWLLVAMNGFTSNFSRGKVAWTKVMTGVECCQLAAEFDQLNSLVVEHVLEKQLKRRVKVNTVTKVFKDIEWE